MEQEVARWLHTQLGYNVGADSTLSTNCRGSLKGLWAFLIANYTSVDNKRHVQQVLARHRREQEAARRAPEEQRQAVARRERLGQLRKRAAELEHTLASLQGRVEGAVREAVDQASDDSMMQHDLQEVQSQLLLLQAFVARNQRLLPALQGKLTQLQGALSIARARCQAPGAAAGGGAAAQQQAVQEQLEQLAGSIMQGLEKAADERIMQAGGALRDLQPAGASGGQQRHPQWEQQAQALVQQVTATPGGGAGTPSLSSGLQDALLSCKLLCGFQLHDDVRAAAVQLLQQQPGTLWGAAAGLASGTLADVTGLLDAAEGEMMAPQVWPLAAASEGGDEDAAAKTGDGSHGGNDTSRPQQPDQQQRQLAAAGPPSGSAKRRLPWASGVSSAIAAAYAARSIPPPPEVRVRMRQLQHMQLFVAAREAEQRCARARQELAMVLGSTPLLQGMLAHAGAGGAAAPLMLTGSNDGGGSGDTSSGASSWEAAAAALHLRAAALQGRLSALRRIEGEQRREADMLLEAEEAYNEKLAKVEEKTLADEQLNLVLVHMSHDVYELFRALAAQQQQVGYLLQHLLVPCGSAAAAAAARSMAKVQAEVNAVRGLPLLRITQPAAAGAAAGTSSGGSSAGPSHSSSGGAHGHDTTSNPVLQQATLTRLQLAAQQLLANARATTGGRVAATAAAATGARGAAAGAMHGGAASSSSSSSGGSRADTAATTALKGAAVLDAVAPVRCPAALLVAVSGQHQALQQQSSHVRGLSEAATAATASISRGDSKAAELQQAVSELHDAARSQHLPHLNALLERCGAVRAFARQELMSDLAHLRDMPAMHLAQRTTYEGKSCSQWLDELRALHAAKRQLSSSRR